MVYAWNKNPVLQGLETCSWVVCSQMWKLTRFPWWPGLSATVPCQQPSPTSVSANSNSRIDCWEQFMPVCLSVGGEGLFKFYTAILNCLQTFLNLLEVSASELCFFSPITLCYDILLNWLIKPGYHESLKEPGFL